MDMLEHHPLDKAAQLIKKIKDKNNTIQIDLIIHTIKSTVWIVTRWHG